MRANCPLLDCELRYEPMSPTGHSGIPIHFSDGVIDEVGGHEWNSEIGEPNNQRIVAGETHGCPE